jgi:hypothetical protein
MTQEDIIEMARQAGYDDIEERGIYMFENFDVEAFAKLVAARKTEEIARYCIWLNDEAGYTDGYDFANAIRVKGQE